MIRRGKEPVDAVAAAGVAEWVGFRSSRRFCQFELDVAGQEKGAGERGHPRVGKKKTAVYVGVTLH